MRSTTRMFCSTVMCLPTRMPTLQTTRLPRGREMISTMMSMPTRMPTLQTTRLWTTRETSRQTTRLCRSVARSELSVGRLVGRSVGWPTRLSVGLCRSVSQAVSKDSIGKYTGASDAGAAFEYPHNDGDSDDLQIPKPKAKHRSVVRSVGRLAGCSVGRSVGRSGRARTCRRTTGSTRRWHPP